MSGNRNRRRTHNTFCRPNQLRAAEFFTNFAADNRGPLDKVTDKGLAESWLDTDLSAFGLPPIGSL